MKKSKWIWYYGDFELYHTRDMMNRREIRGLYYPPMWRVDGIHQNLFVYKIATLDAPEKMRVYSNGGDVSVTVNGVRFDPAKPIKLNAGKNFVKVNVYKPSGLPALFIEGDTFASDESWRIGSYGALDCRVGTSEHYVKKTDDPEKFFFEYKEIYPVSRESVRGGTLFDFGKETFGLLCVSNGDTSREGEVPVVYGESREEALDQKNAVVTDVFDLSRSAVMYKSRAFRYIYVGDKNVDVRCEYEYIPLKYHGKFKTKNAKINKILDVCAYTLHLNTRECFLDGIKRDRWVWGGDAYQSFFVNYYLFNDFDAVRRTTISLFGQEPFTFFTNTIPDYTFLMIMGIYEYYIRSGDRDFLEFMFDKFDGIFRLVDKRLDDRGFFVGGRGDWLFIDWADTAKSGVVCAEQVALCAAYDAAAKCADALGHNGKAYREKAAALRDNINKYFWREERGAYVDCIDRDDRVDVVTRHANIWALLFGVADAHKSERIAECVIKNDTIPAITTPYFEFFELDAMCKIGEFGYVSDMIRSYWGGMLDLGATTIWEQYDPTVTNTIEHYGMYGSKFGKSLCHAWGASPIYLFGRYALGVYPTGVGFETFAVEPHDMGVGNFSGRVPIGEDGGYVDVSFDGETFTAVTNRAGGTLIVGSERIPLVPNEKATAKA
ncbi:MAG: hypothetical protein IKP68_11975 [Clostridia bacterium]|nr:hypothetical protein [Clostridia bacterium]